MSFTLVSVKQGWRRLMSLMLAQGLGVEEIGVVHDAVEDGVGECGLADK